MQLNIAKDSLVFFTFISGIFVFIFSKHTPESPEIQKYLAKMAEENCDVAIIEVSSQAMKLNRVSGCDFDIGLFTNLSEDHISKNEHANMEEYFSCKTDLIRLCKLGINIF